MEYVSFTGYSDYRNIPEEHRAYLRDRRKEAVRYGSQFLNRPSLMNFEERSLSRTERKRFSKELDLLKKLMTHWRQVTVSKNEIAYAVVPDSYVELLKALRQLLTETRIDFQVLGKLPPSMPVWGKNSLVAQWWNFNDLECIASCWHIQVENFLIEIARNSTEKPLESEHMHLSKTYQGRGQTSDTIPVVSESISQFKQVRTAQYDTLRGTLRGHTRPDLNTNRGSSSRQFAEEFGVTTARHHRDLDREDTISNATGASFQPSQQQGRSKDSPYDPPGSNPRDELPKGPPRREEPGDPGGEPPRGPPGRGGPGDPGDDPFGSDGGYNSGRRRRDLDQRSNQLGNTSNDVPRFDTKLKPDSIPTWDGDMERIITWETQLNDLAKRSSIVSKQLGYLVIKFHENSLISLSRPYRGYWSNENKGPPPLKARVNLIGSSTNLQPPQFPKDDSNVSKKASPEEKGLRPCRHCGSGKHWDYECKYARQGVKRARTNHIVTTPEEDQAQEEYDELGGRVREGGFLESSQKSDETTPSNESPVCDYTETTSELRGDMIGENTQLEEKPTYQAKTHMARPSLNRKTRRRLARDIQTQSYSYHTQSQTEAKDLLELPKQLARPSGCSFLGARATEALGYINSKENNPVPVIFDTGSDITLISATALQGLSKPPRIRAGQRINLVQVTGQTQIEGYVPLDLLFETTRGPVKMNVEAYVVKGMSAPFIFGNDFADQYAISMIRKEGRTHLQFGDSDRSIEVQNSITSPYTDENNRVFKKRGRSSRMQFSNVPVRAKEQVIVGSGMTRWVEVDVMFPKNCKTLFIEKLFTTNRNEEDVYGAPDTIIRESENPRIPVANFSEEAITINKGQLLGNGHDADRWLDQARKIPTEDQRRFETQARVLKTIAE
ncbi:hypothetical protein F5890DRAFT_1421900, partial [Lentinula detonsa]